MTDQERFFRALGQRIRQLRKRAGYSQEDMISHGFSARHWQQIEAGRPIPLKPPKQPGIQKMRAKISLILENTAERRAHEALGLCVTYPNPTPYMEA